MAASVLARGRDHAPFLLALCAVLLVGALGLVQPLDNGLSAFRAKLIQREPSQSIVLIDIDARSLAAAPEWPWPRSRFASAINNLNAAGAALIAFDVDFSARSNAADDRAMAEAVDAAPGMIVLPVFTQADGQFQNTPIASLAEHALVGSVNVPIDRDGIVRHYQRGFGDNFYLPSLAAVLAGSPYGDASDFFIDYGIRADQIDRISFDDVVRGAFDPARISGRNVLIGATALELGDEFATPVAPSMPGVLVHALAYESLQQGRALQALNPFIVALLALGALALLWPRRTPLKRRHALLLHGGVLAIALLLPIAVQAAFPISLDFGLLLAAQALALYASVQAELRRRAEQIVRERETHLRTAALHDPETQLPNRRAMLEALAAYLQAGQPVTALAVGVDQFVAMRAAIGYQNASELVQRLAERLAAELPNTRVFHLSTSILGIVCYDARLLDLTCAPLFQGFNTTLKIGRHEINVALRAGAASVNEGSAERLLEQASLALDEARAQQQRFARFTPAMAQGPERLALLSDMAAGLERGEFSIVYQAKARARDGVIAGAEALMRWTHPEHGPISPDLFITAAEKTGTVDALTYWMLRRVASDQALMRAGGCAIPVSVNISGNTFGDPDFHSRANAILAETDAALCFEITETAIIADPNAALATIAKLRKSGVKISIDDYGAGLSSLSYLKMIAADELKTDKSLIADLRDNPRDRLILKSTIDLAHSLGMSVVAEGVEDEATLTLLVAMGCDLVQGYLIGKPESADALVSLAQSRSVAAA